MAETVYVAAALIRDGKKFLICRRPPNKARALQWEFAGGKLEKGEDARRALIRECREELGIEVEPKNVFAVTEFEYDDMTVNITVFETEIVKGEPVLKEHADMRWITANEIPLFEFCDADYAFLEKIKE